MIRNKKIHQMGKKKKISKSLMRARKWQAKTNDSIPLAGWAPDEIIPVR